MRQLRLKRGRLFLTNLQVVLLARQLRSQLADRPLGPEALNQKHAGGDACEQCQKLHVQLSMSDTKPESYIAVMAIRHHPCQET
ncbi:hypothetical protein D3C77_603540 [compost metagenome]